MCYSADQFAAADVAVAMLTRVLMLLLLLPGLLLLVLGLQCCC